jgi:hypothetical protein
MPVPSSSEELEQGLDLIRQELHDGACQYVTAAAAMLEAFRQRKCEDGPDDSSEVAAVLKLLNRATFDTCPGKGACVLVEMPLPHRHR